MNMFSHTKLLIWQKGMKIVEEIYHATSHFPQEERFGLVIQMRKAAISIPSNIAEGSYRATKKNFHAFISIAYGSLGELQTQWECAFRLGLLEEKKKNILLKMLDEERTMLYAFMKTLKK